MAANAKSLQGAELHYPIMFREDSPEEMRQFLERQKVTCSTYIYILTITMVLGAKTCCPLLFVFGKTS